LGHILHKRSSQWQKFYQSTFICFTFEAVKRIIAISLLFIFLFANTELRQFFAMPTLVEHYIEHKQENSTVTFLDYLSQHYSGDIKHNHNNNHGDHEKLPFKTHDFGKIQSSSSFVNHIQFSILRPIVFRGSVFPIYNGGGYFPALQDNIWQPPKIS